MLAYNLPFPSIDFGLSLALIWVWKLFLSWGQSWYLFLSWSCYSSSSCLGLGLGLDGVFDFIFVMIMS